MPGEYKIPKSQFPECCWDCAKCEGKSFTNTSHMTKCSYCPEGTWPTADHSACSPIEAAYLHWDETWAVVIVFFSSFGLAIVTFTGVVFIKFRATPVVRAASRQLCYFLLLGIAIFYVTPLPYIAKPSAVTCRTLPVMFGLCFVLVVGKYCCYCVTASLLTLQLFLHFPLSQAQFSSEQTEFPGFSTRNFFEQGKLVALATTGRCLF